MERTTVYLRAELGVEKDTTFLIPFVFVSSYRAIYYKFIKDGINAYLCQLAYPYCYESTIAPIAECSIMPAGHYFQFYDNAFKTVTVYAG